MNWILYGLGAVMMLVGIAIGADAIGLSLVLVVLGYIALVLGLPKS